MSHSSNRSPLPPTLLMSWFLSSSRAALCSLVSDGRRLSPPLSHSSAPLAHPATVAPLPSYIPLPPALLHHQHDLHDAPPLSSHFSGAIQLSVFPPCPRWCISFTCLFCSGGPLMRLNSFHHSARGFECVGLSERLSLLIQSRPVSLRGALLWWGERGDSKGWRHLHLCFYDKTLLFCSRNSEMRRCKKS